MSCMLGLIACRRYVELINLELTTDNCTLSTIRIRLSPLVLHKRRRWLTNWFFLFSLHSYITLQNVSFE